MAADHPPIAWSSIFIIDPLYSVPLLIAVLAGALFGLHGRTARWPAYALVLTTCYLGFTLAGKQMAEQRVQASITRQGIEVERMFSTPTPFNSLLWRVILVEGEHYYETLVSWWDDAPRRWCACHATPTWPMRWTAHLSMNGCAGSAAMCCATTWTATNCW